MKKTNEALAAQAAKDAMKETEQLCKRAGLTRIKVLKRIKEGLDAKNDFGADHKIRLKSAEMAIVLLDMKPAEKSKIEGELTHKHELSPELEELLQRMKK